MIWLLQLFSRQKIHQELQVELLDRGRPARKRAEGAQPSQMAWHRFSRFALIAGETPAGSGKSLDANQDLVILRV